jgi:hypothetical protein
MKGACPTPPTSVPNGSALRRYGPGEGPLRRACLTGPMDIIRRPVHPRVQRRRALAASLHIPPELGSKFTEGEMAVLKVIADKHGRHGACTLTRDAIGDASGTSRWTVERAVSTAAAEGLIEVRPSSHYNIIAVSATWEAWLDRYGDAP